MRNAMLFGQDLARVIVAARVYAGGFRNMMCGAKTKATGMPCKQKAIYANGRCKLHGGLSVGPRTEEGKKKSAQNGFKKGWGRFSGSDKVAVG